jgi:flavin-dependent dehydrogenase
MEQNMSTLTVRDVDVLVVGGATTGLYYGGLMAAQGYQVLICDKSPEAELGATFDIIHIAKDSFARYGLEEPEPGDAAYVSSFKRSVQRSALNNWPKNSYGNTLVLRRVPLIERLVAWARAQGAEVVLDTSFMRPMFNEKGRLAGAVLRSIPDGDELVVNARLIADASGIPAVVRTALPDDYGVENFVTGPRDQFYVILHYVTLDNAEHDSVDVTTTWTHYKTWLAPQHGSNGAIVGVGANLSFDYAERVYQRFLALGFVAKHKLQHLEQGSTPYCRTPYSQVADGFIALGSAACVSNPWSGEGVPYSWLQCQIAAEISGPALADGALPTVADLWQINVRYAQEQGALFAKNLAMLSGATQCSERENDYEYQQGIIYENQDQDGKSTETGSMVSKLLKGVLTGHISLGTLSRLMGASSIGEKIERHYLAYPPTPEGLAAWSSQAEKLWSKAGSMADVAEADLKSARNDIAK